MHPFDSLLSVASSEIQFQLRGCGPAPWSEFWLNPRRLRGSDFLMRWSQGVWSEHRLIDALERTGQFFAIPYGPSGTAPTDDVRAFELYFERLEQAGLGQIKRPDLLIFPQTARSRINELTGRLGGLSELPFTSEDAPAMRELLADALVAVECENSLWRAERMPDYNAPLKPQRRLAGRPGLKKNAVLPTVIIKEEDRGPLLAWQNKNSKAIHIWHVFFDLALGLPLDEAEGLVSTGLIEPTVQVFQAPGGATTRKVIYKFYHHYAYPLGRSTEEPRLVPDYVEDKNGHILPYVRFEGGRLEISKETTDRLSMMQSGKST